jgi:NADPH:quinone reductase-like Zn-dependent oxidoreductase
MMRKWPKRILKWTALTALLILVAGGVALAIAYWRSDNDCAERRAKAPENPMRAVTYCEYGGPEVLQIEEVEKPLPDDNQILVQVRAVSLNPYDMHFLHGTPYVMRLMGSGLRKPKLTGIGVDFSGVVEAVGRNVTKFQPGDAVFGGRQGSQAEYVVVTAERIAKKPANVSFEEAAGVNMAGRTALQALRDFGNVQPGEKVLINGSSGGVGTYAVQIAKHLGAEVTGVSSGRNTAMVRSLGADRTLDYMEQDYTQGSERYDVIVDNVGNHSIGANRRVLRPNGRYVMVGGEKGRWIKPIDRAIALGIYSRFVEQEMGMMMARSNATDLSVLADLMQQGEVKTVIDRTYELTEVQEAMRHLEAGHAKGKIVIRVSDGGR